MEPDGGLTTAATQRSRILTQKSGIQVNASYTILYYSSQGTIHV